MAILAEIRDPRVRDVTVTHVEVAGDLRSAKVHVSVMGTENKQVLTLRGLQNAAGFLQSRIAEKVEMRFTPKLTFVLDQGVKRSIEVAKILKRVLPPTPDSEAREESAADADTMDENASLEDQPGPAAEDAAPGHDREDLP